MRLTMQDKNEFLKAAIKAPDRESLARWLVSVVDAADTAETATGKADTTVPCPAFAASAGNGHRRAADGAGELWEGVSLP